jgi:hypothetical protein
MKTIDGEDGPLLTCFKCVLTLVGARLPKHGLTLLEATVRFLRFGHWMREHGLRVTKRVRGRQRVWAAVAERVCNRRVLYLEFGVARGASMRYWSEQLRNPESLLHGFDSFEGLPEGGGPWCMGDFDCGGTVPRIDDPRVRFFKGWFDQVLPGYCPPPHDVLVINMDADVYGSTIYVLRALRPYIKPGVYVYFDEFSELELEARAFDEFTRESGLHFKVISASPSMHHIFFECVN